MTFIQIPSVLFFSIDLCHYFKSTSILLSSGLPNGLQNCGNFEPKTKVVEKLDCPGTDNSSNIDILKWRTTYQKEENAKTLYLFSGV